MIFLGVLCLFNNSDCQHQMMSFPISNVSPYLSVRIPPQVLPGRHSKVNRKVILVYLS